MTHATAAEAYVEYVCICGDDELALEEALAVTEREIAGLRRRLGVAR